MPDFVFDSAVHGDRRPTARHLLVDLQIRFGVARRNATAGKIGGYDVAGLLAPIMQPDSEIGGNQIGDVGAVSGQQVMGLGGICAQIGFDGSEAGGSPDGRRANFDDLSKL